MGLISENAVIPITKDSYPQTYEIWGTDGVERINSLMQRAAEAVASSPGCDKLETLGVSDRSAPPGSIVFYADCTNGNRFFITEEDILEGRKTVSQNEKSKWLTDGQLVEISQEAVRVKLQHPCTFLRWSVYRAVVGRTVVTVEFRVANGAGAGVAKCYFDGLSLKEVELKTPSL